MIYLEWFGDIGNAEFPVIKGTPLAIRYPPKKKRMPPKKEEHLKRKGSSSNHYFCRGDLLIFGELIPYTHHKKRMLFPYLPNYYWWKTSQGQPPGMVLKPRKSWDFIYPSLTTTQPPSPVSLPINDLLAPGPFDPGVPTNPRSKGLRPNRSEIPPFWRAVSWLNPWWFRCQWKKTVDWCMWNTTQRSTPFVRGGWPSIWWLESSKIWGRIWVLGTCVCCIWNQL